MTELWPLTTYRVKQRKKCISNICCQFQWGNDLIFIPHSPQILPSHTFTLYAKVNLIKSWKYNEIENNTNFILTIEHNMYILNVNEEISKGFTNIARYIIKDSIFHLNKQKFNLPFQLSESHYFSQEKPIYKLRLILFYLPIQSNFSIENHETFFTSNVNPDKKMENIYIFKHNPI